MFRLLLLLIMVVCASGFLNPPHRCTSSALSMSFDSEIGAQPPLGFWDPLGLLNNADQARFDRLRTVENKHGRISMLAILGHLVTTAGARWPGDIAFGLPFSEMKTGLAALDTIPSGGVYQIICFIGLGELGFSTIKDELEDFCSNKYPNLATEKRMAIELNNDPYIINSLLGSPVPFNV